MLQKIQPNIEFGTTQSGNYFSINNWVFLCFLPLRIVYNFLMPFPNWSKSFLNEPKMTFYYRISLFLSHLQKKIWSIQTILVWPKIILKLKYKPNIHNFTVFESIFFFIGNNILISFKQSKKQEWLILQGRGSTK